MAYRCGDCIICVTPDLTLMKRIGIKPQDIAYGYCEQLGKFVGKDDTPMQHHCEDLPEDRK